MGLRKGYNLQILFFPFAFVGKKKVNKFQNSKNIARLLWIPQLL